MNTEERRILREQVARARGLPDEFLACRLVGHQWDRIPPDRMPMFGRLVVWECRRCEAKRDDIVQPNDGAILSRAYRYPEGYLIPKKAQPEGEGRGGRQFSAGALRIALLKKDNES